MNGIRFGRDEQQLCLASLGTHLVTPVSLYCSLSSVCLLVPRGYCLGDCHLLHYQEWKVNLSEGDEISGTRDENLSFPQF